MLNKTFKKLVIIFSCLLFLAGFRVEAQMISNLEIIQPNQPKIISTENNPFWEGGIFVKGESSPNVIIWLSIKDKDDVFSYSIKTNSDDRGKWFVKLDQPLKSGEYHIEAVAQGEGGFLSSSTDSGLIKIKGPFSTIINIFSFLIIVLLFCFLAIWYTSRSAEIKRYRRILSSQRDIVSSYNILKKDVDEAIKKLNGNKIEEQKIHEVEFFLNRINENLEKINKYVIQGINVIGKYDIVSKIDNALKFKKNKK